MTGHWRTWTVFALCSAAVLAAMSWLTFTALELDRARAEAAQKALLEENVRLALWRMDSFVTGLLAQENARRYFAAPPSVREGRAPPANPYALARFRLDADGELSPLFAAEAGRPARDPSELLGALAAPELVAAMRAAARSADTVAPDVEPQLAQAEQAPLDAQSFLQQESARQATRNISEWRMRGQNVLFNAAVAPPPPTAPETASGFGLLQPLWLSGSLLLVRSAPQNCVQGCLLDWPAIKSRLLSDVQDLLPGAELRLLGDGNGFSRRLASLPVRLEPGKVLSPPEPSASAIRLSLVVAWAFVLTAAASVAALLYGAVSLSERRGAFVSAVTHEMRTPLTTFRMYAEMLGRGMVPDEKRPRYLETLRTEADRLGHLVENVLAYARLERGSARGRVEDTTVRALLDRTADRLAQRAELAGMTVAVEQDEAKLSLALRADPSAVEQVLFNLVDNACKYAANADNRAIEISAAEADRLVELRVRDYGPGISPEEARRLFRPFTKSARDAANTAPGVGLGLALSRRLARTMGGDLRLDTSVRNGACLVLALPAANKI